MSWTTADSGNAFLALDRNGNGTIDDGGELFGNVTDQPPTEHPNGYIALSAFDTNGDGVIDAQDPVFGSLRLWIDANHNGVSEPNELHSLSEFGIVSIPLQYWESRRVDRYGNVFRYRSRILTSRHPAGVVAYDVFLVVAH